MDKCLNVSENLEGRGKNCIQQPSPREPLNCNGRLARGDKLGYVSKRRFEKPALLTVVFLILITVIIALAAVKFNPSSVDPAATHCCPDGWVGYQGQCYYFSEAEGSWTDSQDHCFSLGASLAGINTQQDLAFIKRYKGLSEHWIGLRREPGQPWKWTNGTKFSHWFEVRADGECAYLNDVAVASSWCDTVRYWICSKPAARWTRNEEHAAQGQSEMSKHG